MRGSARPFYGSINDHIGFINSYTGIYISIIHGECRVKVIFLDIDGVLNCRDTEETINDGKVVGVEDEKIERLKQIVDATRAVIVLVSSWKLHRDDHSDSSPMRYLNRKLFEHGLKIYDYTIDRSDNRGYGILKWYSHRDVSKWIVLDDEIFGDYKIYGIVNHLVKPSFEKGLQDEHVAQAIEMLGD